MRKITQQKIYLQINIKNIKYKIPENPIYLEVILAVAKLRNFGCLKRIQALLNANFLYKGKKNCFSEISEGEG